MERDLRLKAVPWARVFLEGAVIVGSILLAFALDAWWDERSRTNELREQAEVVADEMESAREALEAVLGMHDWTARLAAHLTATLHGVAEGAEVVVSDTLVGPLLPQTTADVTTGALDAFIAAGGLEIIDDADVRRELRAWPTEIEDLQDDEIFLRNFAAAELATYLRASAAVANAELRSFAVIRHQFGVGPAVDPDSLGVVALRHEQRLLNLLAARESQERGIREGIVEMLEQADRIVAALEAMR